ncbi:MAG: TlpA disulfide reductase family protein [Pirellula sp.]
MRNSVSIAALWLLASLQFASESPAAVPIAADSVASKSTRDKALGTLHLIGGDVYRGQFATVSDSAQLAGNGSLVWSCPAFDSNVIVPWSQVERLAQPESLSPNPVSAPLAQNEFIIQLQNGESITGKITQLTESTLEVDSPLAGKRALSVDSIQCILRSIQNSHNLGGLLSIENWKQINPPIKPGGRSKWFEQTGSFNTETTGTSISQMVTVPDLAAIDVEVAWEQVSPNWTLTLGEPRRLELHFRKMETRKTISISILVDGEATADVDTAQLPSEGITSISLRILCDSNRGRFVLLHAGNVIAQLQLSKSTRLAGKHNLAFTNIGLGRISLREIRVYPSIFSVPFSRPGSIGTAVVANESSPETLLRSGETFLGRPTQFDAETQTFSFAESNANIGRVKLADVDRIEFPYKTPAVVQDSTTAKPKLYVAELRSGARYVGQSLSQESNLVILRLEDMQTTIRIPIDEVKLIGLNIPQRNKPLDGADPLQSRMMKFVSPWAISTGFIDKVGPSTNTSGATNLMHLYWKPRLANSLPLTAHVSGIIEPLTSIPDPPPVVTKSPYSATTSGIKRVEPDFGRPLKANDPSLFLRNGDCFPASVTLVNETNTLFKSELFEVGVIGNDQIRGIRILDYRSADSIEKGARKKLLTLPRAQRQNPPTHLIVSRQGDAVRGHLKGLTEDFATLEVRGNDHSIVMKTVAEIIWLPEPPEVVPPANAPSSEPKQSDEQTASKEVVPVVKQADDSKPPQLKCLALFSTGTRFSFVPQNMDGDVLNGLHPQLGACRVDLSKVSRLVLGDAIESDSQWNWFGKWQLENAPDPKFVNDLDSPDGGDQDNALNAMHTKMVGAAAPNFELKKLDGNMLRLADLKGKIVVLDFWATWCGPCVASLPKLNEVAQEYKGAGVELVAVNIEQKPAEIQALLNRLEINPTVALDSDGAIARAYRAQAIPQTVIIDRQGRVAHIIVGGGEATEKKVRESINILLESK